MSADGDLVKKTQENGAFTVHHFPKSRVPKPLKKKKVLIGVGSFLTLIIIVGVGLYYFQQYQNHQAILSNPTASAAQKQQEVIAKVGQLIELPTGEQPAIATVTDITKLQSQPFFQNAKNGDIVFIYSKAKEAILYDPVSNKIVRVGQINGTPQNTANTAPNTGSNSTVTPANSAVAAAATKIAQEKTIAIYNGTTITGLAMKTVQTLAKTMPNLRVVEETNASKSDYTHTTVVDLTGKNAQAAQQVASVLNGTVGSVPKGEARPADVDLLVVLGSQ